MVKDVCVGTLGKEIFRRKNVAATVLEPQKKKTRLMTEGSIWKNILLFSVPLILGNLLQQLYNTADSIIVGNFVGSNALAAVGSSGSPIFLLIGFSQGIAVGAGVVVAQYLGAKDRKEAQEAVHTSLALAAILGLILTVGGIFISRSLLMAMDTPAEVLEDAVTYMQIYFGGVLFSVVYNMAAGILNAAGNSQRSLLYLGIASGTNILLDLVLIAGLKMGVAGAAIATDVSQLVSCVLSLGFLMRVNDDYRVTAKEIKVHRRWLPASSRWVCPPAFRTWSSRCPTFWSKRASTATVPPLWPVLRPI